jgi:hypothetical protein
MFDATIRLYLDKTAESSYVTWQWQGGALLQMTLGYAPQSWSRQYDNLLHETLELAFRLRRCHFEPASVLTRSDTGRYRFFCDHEEFSEISRHAADMLVYAGPALEEAWERLQKAA